MSLLGIDLGTSGCKAAAYALDGKTIAKSRREYSIFRPQPLWAELDPHEIADAALSVITEVISACTSDPVTAISVSSMGEAMVPIGHDGEVLGNSILMVDSRGREYADELGRKVGMDHFYHINPNILSPNYSYPKLAWLRDNQSDMFEQTACFLLVGDYVLHLLGGEKVTSFSLANRTLLFDISTETWSSELLNAGGIPEEKLPRPVASGTICGKMSEIMTARLGLKDPPVLVVGAHDQCCSSLGSGVTQAGRASCGIGTVECIAPTYDHIPDAKTMRAAGLNVEHHALPGLYVSFIYNQAGSLITWFAETFANPGGDGGIPNGLISTLDSEIPEDPTGLLVLPYFEMTGAPTFVEGGFGSILGLSTSTTRGEIFKAVMECETFYFVQSINTLRSLGVDTSEFIATGGGAKSDPWLQIKADIFGIPFIRPQITEGGTLGAAILAGLAVGTFGTPEQAVEIYVKPDRTFYPNQERHVRYLEKLGQYDLLYPTIAEIIAPTI